MLPFMNGGQYTTKQSLGQDLTICGEWEHFTVPLKNLSNKHMKTTKNSDDNMNTL